MWGANHRSTRPCLLLVYLYFLLILLHKITNVSSVLFAGTPYFARGPGSMGKFGQGKIKSKSGQRTSKNTSHYVVIPGESYWTLQDYLDKNPKRVVNEEPPGQLSNTSPEPEYLAEPIRLLIFRMIDMLDDLVTCGTCLDNLEASNIVILKGDARPKLIGVQLLKRTDNLAMDNYSGMARIIRRHVLDQAIYNLPVEVEHLLYLMENDPLGMAFLINHHSAIVPMENRSTLYTRMYNYLWDILRMTDPDGFLYVLNNLEYDQDWDQKIQSNKFLQLYFMRSKYDPQGRLLTTIREHEILRFNRNGPAHALENAANQSSPSGLLFNHSDVAHMFHAYFHRLIFSLSAGLQRLGCLCHVQIRSLFTSAPKGSTNKSQNIV